MRTTYIFDTSTLIYDPCAWKQFSHSDVIIPIAVLNELDKLKKQSGEAGKNARVCIRLLDELSDTLDITTGIITDQDTLVKIDATYRDVSGPDYAGFGDPDYGDTQILACAVDIYRQNPGNDVFFVSNDINLRVKAKSRGLNAISHENDKYHVTELYAGFITIEDEEAGLDLQRDGFIDPLKYGFFHLSPNECILFTNSTGDGIALGRKVARDKIKLVKKVFPWNIAGRNQEQIFAMDLIMDKKIDLVTLIGKAGSGKAQPIDAEILTPTGYVKMGDIKIGDTVSTPDGATSKVIGVYPQGIKDIYKVSFTDGTSTECCEDHLWLTKTSLDRDHKRGGSVKSLKEIAQTLKYGKKRNHSIPMTEPIIFEKQNNLIHPYLLGVLLGDAYIGKYIQIATKDKEIIDSCSKLLLPNYQLKKKDDIHYNLIKVNQDKSKNIVLQELKRLGLNKKSYYKFIPDCYKYTSIEDRIELLQGLMDTDGFSGNTNKYENVFYTTSIQLSEDVKFLVESLGGTAVIRPKQTSYTYKQNKIKGRPSFAVYITIPNGIKLFKLNKKLINQKLRTKYHARRYINNVELVGQKIAQCILIDSDQHLYLTNNFIVTHNTLVTVATALDLVISKKEYDKFIIYRPIQPVGNDIGYLPGTMEEKLAPWFHAIMDNFEVLFSNKGGNDWRRDLEMFQKKGKIEMEAITYIRGRSIPNSIILIDECQNLNKEEVKTILTRAGEGTKIILTGDIEQIDNSLLDATNNGLTHVIEKFKSSDLAGHITFTKGERSKLASEAADIL